MNEPGLEGDLGWMRRAIELAARGDFRTHPNPRVGAVLVRQGRLLGEGYHEAAGGPHAEPLALAAARAAGHDPAGATLYVTLEPCGRFPGKRTPSCLEALLPLRLARVVVAQEDPHPAMRGAGLARLREAGVAVELGLLEAEARRLNGPFNKWSAAGLPYVTAKWAMSLDGKIATRSGESRWISGEASRLRVHRLRGEVDAVAVGVGTALQDDPALTRRGVPGRDPLRVVLDSRARLPLSARLVQSARERPTLVLVTAAAPSEQVAALRGAGVEVEVVPDAAGRPDPVGVLQALARRGVRHLLLEGGGQVLAAFLAAGAVDRVECYLAPLLVGGQGAPGPVGGQGVERLVEALRLAELRAEPCGPDLLVSGLLREW